MQHHSLRKEEDLHGMTDLGLLTALHPRPPWDNAKVVINHYTTERNETKYITGIVFDWAQMTSALDAGWTIVPMWQYPTGQIPPAILNLLAFKESHASGRRILSGQFNWHSRISEREDWASKWILSIFPTLLSLNACRTSSTLLKLVLIYGLHSLHGVNQ